MWNNTRMIGALNLFLTFLLQNVLKSLFIDRAPFILLLTVIFYSLAEGRNFGFAAGLFAGFLLDLQGTLPLGSNMLSLGLVGWFCGFFSSKIFRESVLTQIFLPFFILIFLAFIQAFQFSLYSKENFSFLGFWRLVGSPFAWVLTLAISPFFFSFLKKTSFVRKERTPWA